MRDAIERQDDCARRATRERLDEVYEIHAKKGLIRTGATLIIGIAVFEEEARSLIVNLVGEVSPLTRNAGTFSRISETVEQFLSLMDGELGLIVKKVEQELQDSAKLSELSQGAEILWAEKRASLLDELEQHRSEFTAHTDEAKEGPAPTQTCLLCRHWEPMSEAPECHAGLCRRFALGPKNDGWAITEAGDGCDDWSGEGFFKAEDGSIQADRRAFVRTRVDWPALLRTPSGEWSGRMIDISEKGARIKLRNPPRVGASALLKWGSCEFFCDVAWANQDSCGVSFEKPLPRKVLIETAGVRDEPIGPVADPMKIPVGKKRIA